MENSGLTDEQWEEFRPSLEIPNKKGRPYKNLRKTVKFITVNVIYFGLIFRIRDKGFRHKTVNFAILFLAADFERNSQIAERQVRLEYSYFSFQETFYASKVADLVAASEADNVAPLFAGQILVADGVH